MALGRTGEVQLGTEQHRQELVPGCHVWFVARQDQMNFHAEPGTRSSSHPAVIRLCCTDRNQRPSADRKCITAQEIKLASFVASPAEPCQIVPFDPQPRSPGNDRALFQRCRRGGEPRSLEVLEHGFHARHRC